MYSPANFQRHSLRDSGILSTGAGIDAVQQIGSRHEATWPTNARTPPELFLDPFLESLPRLPGRATGLLENAISVKYLNQINQDADQRPAM
jgi:hypothetical protein